MNNNNGMELILVKNTSMRFVLLVLLFSFYSSTFAQTLSEIASQKINELETLILAAEEAGIDVIHEKTTVRTAEIFLTWADWDENNKAENEGYFGLVSAYKNNSNEMAELLPDFERQDVIDMLEASISYLNGLIDGSHKRKPSNTFDWSMAQHDGDQISYNGRPVFLADYTWQEEVDKFSEYHGAQDGFFISPSHVLDAQGNLNSTVINELQSKGNGNLGFIFINNKNVKQWAENLYGPGFKMREDTFTGYDIDNPGAREMMGHLLAGTVPQMAGKKFSELGYMLCNEPHFFTNADGEKDVWASGPVSNYSIDKFKIWLTGVHNKVADLNDLWGSNFATFEDVEIQVPIDISNRGTPKWYDWVRFNNYRVTEWYSWMKSEVQKHDSNAKVHLKVMPNLWTENNRNHGLDMEALTKMSNIIGNDAGAHYNHMWKTEEWMDRYQFQWREMCMGHDFFKSVSPDKIMYNTEVHFLTTGRSRDLYMEPRYARTIFWMAHTQGLTASQTWFWPRREDGHLRPNPGNGYAGSNNHQPRVTNEVATTMLDLNTFSEEIMAFQRQRKPIRIFYSETSAIQKPDHMDDVFELYEELNFEGVPIGFATEDIINSHPNSNWDVINIYKTPFVTEGEITALQSYLDNGGTIIMDSKSLTKNEYGQSHTTSLSGNVINSGSSEGIASQTLTFIEGKGELPKVALTESSSVNFKNIIWKCVENESGNQVLSIHNVGKVDVEIELQLKNAANGTKVKDLIMGIDIPKLQTLRPYDMLFLEVRDEKEIILNIEESSGFMIYPNPSTGEFVIQLPNETPHIMVSITDIQGRTIARNSYQSVDRISSSVLKNEKQGVFFIKVSGLKVDESFKILKE